MAKKPETIFKEKVMRELDKLAPLVWYTKIQQVVTRGDPDLVLCVNGYFVCWELKVDSPVEALQMYTLGKVREAGGSSHIVTPENIDYHLGIVRKFCAKQVGESPVMSIIRKFQDAMVSDV